VGEAPLLPQVFRIESDKLFEFDILDPEVVDEEGEDSLRRLALPSR